MPDVSKIDFRTRLNTAVNGQASPRPNRENQSPAPVIDATAAASGASAPTLVAANSPSQPPSQQTASGITRSAQSGSQGAPPTRDVPAKKQPQEKTIQKSSAPKPQPLTEGKKEAPSTKREKKSPGPKRATVSADDEADSQRPAPRGPPTQYRLQVRLFDGGSVRSSFTPTQTIDKDVRPWLDEKMGDDNRPYNLKHILTPLPSRTLSVAEESQTLQDLGLGSTANLVMVPVQTYTEAYASTGSLPVRGASAIYNIVSSVARTTTGLVGSLVGYGSNTSAGETPPTPAPAETSQRLRPSGPNIRTLGDRQDQDNSQLYNGNQVCIYPDLTGFEHADFELAQLRAPGPE